MSGYASRSVASGDRRFLVEAVRFGNGIFVSVTEGGRRLGAVEASLPGGAGPVSTTVIPSRAGSPFVRLVSEKACRQTGGICIASVGTDELDDESARAVASAVKELAGSG